MGTAFIMPDKGGVERPYRHIREDFFLARSFQNLDDLKAQLRHWLDMRINDGVKPGAEGVIATGAGGRFGRIEIATFRQV